VVRAPTGGMALPLVLLLLLALTAFGHGVLLLSRQELKASWAFRDLIRAGQAAEIGLRLGWGTPVGAEDLRRPGAAVPVISGETLGGLTYETSRRWLDTEFFLLESRGGLRGWGGEKNAGWIGWALDPGTRITSFLGAVEVGLEVRRDPGDSSGRSATSRIPPLGLLSGDELLKRVNDPSPSGGVERDGMDCWDRAFGIPARGSSDDVVLQGREECGLLVVGGDLRLENKVRFRGLALVGGNLILDKGSTFEGMAKVGGALILRLESRFIGSPLQALRALEGVPSMTDPLLVQRGMSLGGM
jgi:hypothetical protein